MDAGDNGLKMESFGPLQRLREVSTSLQVVDDGNAESIPCQVDHVFDLMCGTLTVWLGAEIHQPIFPASRFARRFARRLSHTISPILPAARFAHRP